MRPEPSLLEILVIPVVAAGLLFSGCAHTVLIESDPPGADVYIENEHVGQTPLEWQETTSHSDFIAVEVRDQGHAQRFYLHRDGIGLAPTLGGIGGGVGGVVLGMMGIGAYIASYVFGVVLLSSGEEAIGISLITGGMVFYFVGLTLVTLGINLPFMAIGEWGRKSPDRVQVNLWDGVVVTDPPGKSSPLLGRGPDLKKGKTKPSKAPLSPKPSKDPPHVGPVIDPQPQPEGKIDPTDLLEE